MKFISNKQDLYTAVSTASRVCAVKSTIPALEGVLLRLESNSLSATGYNLEMGIVAEINVQGVSDGAIVANGKLLTEILKKLDNDKPVEITLDGATLHIKSGRTKLKTQAISVEDYPTLPTVDEGESFSLTGEQFKRLVNQTTYAVALNDLKPAHTGCKFTLKDRVLIIDGVDGVRIARASEQGIQGNDVSVVIPAKSLQEVNKSVSLDDENITISITNSFTMIAKQGLKFISRTLSGEFISVDKVLSVNGGDTLKVSTSALLSAIERVSVIADNTTKSPVIMDIHDNVIDMSVKTSLGEVTDSVEVEYGGQAVKTAFNPKYLKEAVSHAESDIINALILGALKPLMISESGSDRYTAVILPVRVKE